MRSSDQAAPHSSRAISSGRNPSQTPNVSVVPAASATATVIPSRSGMRLYSQPMHGPSGRRMSRLTESRMPTCHNESRPSCEP
nr:hypothetical protein [Paenibacillus sp. YYML68]